MATRTGSAEWRGDLKGGDGNLTVGDGVFEGAYSFSSRFEEGQGTNPEELIAAAHAACFTMQLSNILAEHGHTPDWVRTVGKVHLRHGEKGPTIQRIDLETEGRVDGLDEEHFAERAEEAKSGCIVSRALAGVEEMTVTATLRAELRFAPFGEPALFPIASVAGRRSGYRWAARRREKASIAAQVMP